MKSNTPRQSRASRSTFWIVRLAFLLALIFGGSISPVAAQRRTTQLRPEDAKKSQKSERTSEPEKDKAASATGDSTSGRTTSQPAMTRIIACPHCDKNGKHACPDCDGRGQIFRPCKICEGSGKRPCKTCNGPEPKEDNAPGPGSILCPYCAGHGSIGEAQKKCPKCRGAMTQKCPTCRGKTKLNCRKETFESVCGRCGFTKRIVCTHCKGSRKISVRVEPKVIETATGADSSNSKVERGPQTLEDRLQALKKLDQQVKQFVLFLADGDDAESVYSSAVALGDRLPRVKDEDIAALREQVIQLRRNASRARLDLSELVSVQKSFQKNLARCENQWAKKEGAQSDKERRANWLDDMGISLRICERNADQMAGADSLAIMDTLTELRHGLASATAKTEEILKQRTQAKEDRAKQDKSEATTKNSDSSTAAKAGATGSDSEAGTKPKPEGELESSAKTIPPAEGKGAKTTRAEKAPTTSERSEDASSGSILAGTLWALGCAIVLLSAAHLIVRRKLWAADRT